MPEPTERDQEMAADFWEHAELPRSTWARRELALMFADAREEGRLEGYAQAKQEYTEITGIAWEKKSLPFPCLPLE